MNVFNNQFATPRNMIKAAAVATALSVSAWAGATQSASTFDDLLESNARISLFAQALDQSGLINEVNEGSVMTVFIPTNTAMDTDGSRFLLESVLVAQGNEQRLKETISYHIVPGEFEMNSQPGATLDGGCLDVSVAERITETVEYGSVTVHFVDGLLGKAWDDERICGVRS